MPKLRTVFAIMVLLFILGYGAGFLGLGWYIDWGNHIFHFVGGLFSALLVVSYYSNEFSGFIQTKRSALFVVFVILGLVAFIGVLWEFHEYSLDKLFQAWPWFRSLFATHMSFSGDINDTMQDLLVDILGAVPVALWFAYLHSGQRRDSQQV